MDAQIGLIVAALDKVKLRDNTLIVFMSDNGGTRNAMFTGSIADVSKITIPCDNGPYRDGKGTLYEGGTRVVALMNWPGRIKPGVVDGPIHVVDMYPTLAAVSGAKLGKNKPLDGMDMWPTISEGKPSPRTEVVYNIEPMAGAVRQGDWKLVWKATLPQRIELFNLAEDKSETTDLIDKNPEKAKELQARISELAAEMAPPLLILELVPRAIGAPLVTPDLSEMLGNVGD